MNIDEDTIGQMMQRVDDEPRSAPRIDVMAAMKAGRQRRRARAAASMGGGAAAVAVVVVAAVALSGVTSHRAPLAAAPSAASSAPTTSAAPSASATPSAPATPTATSAPTDPAATRGGAPAVPTQCTGRFLPLPKGVNSAIIADGDSSGRYLVGYSTGSAAYGPILWTDGQPTLIPANASFGGPVVNSHGEVAGSALTPTTSKREEVIAWIYRDGKVTRLVNGDTSYMVAGINDNGDVLAIPVPRFSAEDIVAPMAPVVLNGDHVRHLGEIQSTAVGTDFSGDIGNDGTVVGYAGSGDAWIWTPDGQPHALKGPGAHTYASGVSNGWVIGGSATGGVDVSLPGLFPAVRWDLRTGTTKTFPTVTYPRRAVTASGWFVGSTKGGPVAVFGDTIRRLPHVPGAVQSEEFAFATTISDDGHVIGGQSDHPGDVIGPVEWTCH